VNGAQDRSENQPIENLSSRPSSTRMTPSGSTTSSSCSNAMRLWVSSTSLLEMIVPIRDAISQVV